MPTVSYKIRGLDCAEEVAALRAALAPLTGVRDVGIDLLSGKLAVTFGSGKVNESDLLAAIRRTGLNAEPWRNAAGAHDDSPHHRTARGIATATSGALAAAAFLIDAAFRGWVSAVAGHQESGTPLIARACYLAAVIAGAWYVAPKALLALRRVRPDMNLLMTVAVAGAIILGEYFEAATVSFLFALSLTLESWSVGRARRAVASLLAITPPKARVIRDDGSEELADVADVPPGSRVVVKPGERFPLDGKVVRGETTVDQSPITGESMPVPKSPGSDVFAGTINQDGAIELLTTRPAADTTLSRIIHMVSEARSRRAPSERWVEKFTAVYTPVAMTLAIAVMLVPPLLGGGVWSRWFYNGLVLLVIACPCALVISTPVSIVAALTSAARHGVLVKGGLYLELPASLKAIALDKTGTLTEGRPRVRQLVSMNGHTERELMEIAAAVEQRSEHPLARAIVEHATSLGIDVSAVENFQAIKGKGATATLAGRRVWIGSHRLLEERAQETGDVHQKLEAMEAVGLSAVVIGNEEHVCGFIGVGDRVRPNAAEIVRRIKSAGVERVVMLSGDNRGTAEAVAKETGVDEVRAELLPEDKVAAVEQLVAGFGAVAMVGDGVNDAPAMARASLGIAMGAMGTDAAIETADIALMSDDLSRIPWLIHHSRRTMGVIRQNIVASLTIKGVFVVLALVGRSSLWAAIAADMGVSLAVVFNALRLLRDAPGSVE